MSRFNRVSGSNVSSVATLPPALTQVVQATPAERPLFVQNYNPIQRAGFFLLLIYIFGVVSLLTETSMNVFGFKPYVTMVTGPLTMACVLASGGLRRAFRGSIGLWLTGFSVWLLVALPFSVWRTGSLELVGNYFVKNLSMFFLTAGLVMSLREYRRFVWMLAFAAVIILFVALAYGESADGARFAISFGSFRNPNDFSTHLLVLLPFVLFVGLNSRSIIPMRPLVALTICAMIFTIVQTGSRSGAIGLAAVILMIVVKARPVQRVVYLAVFVLVSVAALSVLQNTLIERFQTIFAPMSPSQEMRAARMNGTIGSNLGRMYLLRRSVELTIANPIFGVGPGQFAVAESGEAEKEGLRGIWLGTHNSYTQVSSETGLPGLLLFVATIAACIRACNRVYKRAKENLHYKQIANLAFCLSASLTGFAVNIFFCHVAYTYYLPMLAGMTVALVQVSRQEMTAPSRSRLSTDTETSAPSRAGLSTDTEMTAPSRSRLGTDSQVA